VRRVVVGGAGEVAESVLRTLHQQGVPGVVVVNRHPDRAELLAGSWNMATARWEELPHLLATADLLFVTTSAKRPCIGAGLLARVADARAGRELVVMDLSVPRNVDPGARSLAGIRILDLDDLQRLCCPVGDGTISSTAVAQAEQVLLEELTRLDLTMRSRAHAPRLAELHRLGGEIAEREASWALARLGCLSEREQQIVRDMAQRLVRRVLYPVSRSIRLDETGDDDAEESLSA
jgi:glutamyl-tRNA reductase